jgi:hypothetical protein
MWNSYKVLPMLQSRLDICFILEFSANILLTISLECTTVVKDAGRAV